MVSHRINRREIEQALGVGEGQGSLECCCPQGPKELDTTEQLNCTELMLLRKVRCTELYTLYSIFVRYQLCLCAIYVNTHTFIGEYH